MSFDTSVHGYIPAGYFCIKNVQNTNDDNHAIDYMQLTVNRTGFNGTNEYIAMQRIQHKSSGGKHPRNWWEKHSFDDKESRVDEGLFGGRILIDGETDVEFSLGVINVFKRKAKKAGDF